MAGNGSEPRRSVTSKVVAIIRSFGSGRSLTITEVAQVADLPLSTTTAWSTSWRPGDLDRGDDARYEMCCRPSPSGCRDAPRPPHGRSAGDRGSQCGDEERRASRRLRRPPGAVRREGVRGPAAVRVLRRRHTSRARDGTRQGAARLLPPETVDNVVRHGLRGYTASTVATAARLRHALKVTRLRGMAVASGELLPGHCAVAVPVFGPAGEVAASLEVRLRDISVRPARHGSRAHGRSPRSLAGPGTDRHHVSSGRSRGPGRRVRRAGGVVGSGRSADAGEPVRRAAGPQLRVFSPHCGDRGGDSRPPRARSPRPSATV